MTVDKFSMFRIISFTLAGGDVFQTMPGTYRLYKKQWINRSLSPVCFFYAATRYLSILSLITNGIGFFSTDFTPASCKRFYMLPNVTAMLAGMAVQALIFIRTYAISGRSKVVLYGLGAVLAVCLPLQVFGITYHRDPFLSNGGCKGKVLHPGEPDWNIVFYSAHMAFDLIACATGTFFLAFLGKVQGSFNSSKFLRRVMRNGLLYFFTVFGVNLWVVLEFAGAFSSGAASTLPLAVVMIAAQHLILSTQRLTGKDDSSFDGSPNRQRTESGAVSGPARFFNSRATQPDVELQPGIFKLSEPYSDETRRSALLTNPDAKTDFSRSKTAESSEP